MEGAQTPLKDGSIFLPVEVSKRSIDHVANEASLRAAGATSASLLAHRVDITLSDGRRVVIEGPAALSSVVGFKQGLMA